MEDDSLPLNTFFVIVLIIVTVLFAFYYQRRKDRFIGHWSNVDITPTEIWQVEDEASRRTLLPWVVTPTGRPTALTGLAGRALLYPNGITGTTARLKVLRTDPLDLLFSGWSPGTHTIAVLEDRFVPFEMIWRIYPIELYIITDRLGVPSKRAWGLQIETRDLRTMVLYDKDDPGRLSNALLRLMGTKWDLGYRHLGLRGRFEEHTVERYRSDHRKPEIEMSAYGDIFKPEVLRLRSRAPSQGASAPGALPMVGIPGAGAQDTPFGDGAGYVAGIAVRTDGREELVEWY